jgi:peroxiredoxin
MSQISHVMPRQAAPGLEVSTLDGDTWRLADQAPGSFTMVVVYRGLHCPICSRYLADLDRKLGDFAELGVGVIALSSDPEDRARTAREDWKLENLKIGYGLDLDTARAWGLYVSSGIGTTSAGIEEPDLFAEPGLFLVRADGTVYFASVQTMPFARPSFAEVLGATKFVLEKGYPARGEVVDHTVAQAAE